MCSRTQSRRGWQRGGCGTLWPGVGPPSCPARWCPSPLTASRRTSLWLLRLLSLRPGNDQLSVRLTYAYIIWWFSRFRTLNIRCFYFICAFTEIKSIAQKLFQIKINTCDFIHIHSAVPVWLSNKYQNFRIFNISSILPTYRIIIFSAVSWHYGVISTGSMIRFKPHWCTDKSPLSREERAKKLLLMKSNK